MPENTPLVTASAIAAVSLVTAVRSRVALIKEQDAYQHLANKLTATEWQRQVLLQIIDDRGISLTKEEAHRLAAMPLPK